MNGKYIAQLFSKTFLLKAPQNVDPGGRVVSRRRWESVGPCDWMVTITATAAPLSYPSPFRNVSNNNNNNRELIERFRDLKAALYNLKKNIPCTDTNTHKYTNR